MHEKDFRASGREKRRIALTSVLASPSLTILKLTVAMLTNSLAILSGAINSGLDIVASLVTFLAVRASDRPPGSVTMATARWRISRLSARP